MPKRRKHYFGAQFDERRTKEGRGDMTLFLDNLTSLSVEAGSTHFDHLLAIAHTSDKPFPVKYLHPKLKETQSLRGVTYFKNLSGVIEGILLNHPSMRWWMEADGLVVDEVPPELDSLSPFDRIVGPLSIQLQQNGRLSRDAINSISSELDAKGFKLKEHLQRQEREDVAAHNRKRTGNQIVSFASAAKSRDFHKSMRRSIYRARDRYKEALRLQS